MKAKELAEKLNKKITELKPILAEYGISIKAGTSDIDDNIAAEIIRKITKPKPTSQVRVVKVIKKRDLDAVAVVDGTTATATEKAAQFLKNEKVVPEKEAEETKADKKSTAPEEAEEELSADENIANAAGGAAAHGAAVVDVSQLLTNKKDGHVVKPTKYLHEERMIPRKEKNVYDVFRHQQKKRKSKYKKLKLKLKEEERIREEEELAANPITEITIEREVITVSEFAELIRKKPAEIIGALLKENMLVTINQEIDLKLASHIGELLGVTVKADFSEKEDSKIKYDIAMMEKSEVEDTAENLKVRPPIVTIMGHVDHGKTKLLDTIRSTKVAEGEAGGITQHIGAYQVDVHGRKITFLDTPGHEAFTALRARGSQVTDIVILVVAANDGIMPQTIEAIDHAKDAGVPIIVAINKIDLPEANVEKVKQQLTEHELVPEEWGGKTICCEISAKQKIGIDNLLEIILLVADMEELKSNPNKKAQGIVIESQLSKQKGPVATILIKAGTLRKGDCFVIGHTYGRVRAMFNDLGKEVEEALPAYPVEILGIMDVPRAGEMFLVMDSEKEARQVAENKQADEKERMLIQRRKTTLAAFSKESKEGQLKTMKIVLKADVQGSLEALVTSIEKLNNNQVSISIIHRGTGVVNRSDVMLAKASAAVILAFSVGKENEAGALALNEGIEIREYDIIYKLLEDLELAMKGLLEPEYETVQIGRAEIRSIFKSSKAGKIAGAFVTEGLLRRNCKIKLYRGNKLLHEGSISTLKRFKDDVKEVQHNFECGFVIDKFEDIQEGDYILAFETREKVRA